MHSQVVSLPFGATLHTNGGDAFALRAPAMDQVVLEHAPRDRYSDYPMRRDARGESCAGLPLNAYVSFLQSHHQIGNRAHSERLHQLADPLQVCTALACIMLSPHAPMLFMGEEFAASTPLPYFCDCGPELGPQVAEGRRAEIGRLAEFASAAAQATIADPNAPSSMAASRPRWDELQHTPHREGFAFVRTLLAVRRTHRFDLLQDGCHDSQADCAADTIRVRWSLGTSGRSVAGPLHLLAHFGAEPVVNVAPLPGRLLYANDIDNSDSSSWSLAAGAVALTVERVRHG